MQKYNLYKKAAIDSVKKIVNYSLVCIAVSLCYLILLAVKLLLNT
jgi:hypothetical protein